VALANFGLSCLWHGFHPNAHMIPLYPGGWAICIYPDSSNSAFGPFLLCSPSSISGHPLSLDSAVRVVWLLIGLGRFMIDDWILQQL
jgi:hypothetical protein